MPNVFNPYGFALFNEATGASAFPYDYKDLPSNYGNSLATGDPVSLCPYIASLTAGSWRQANLGANPENGCLVKTPLQYTTDGSDYIPITPLHYLPIYGIFCNIEYTKGGQNILSNIYTQTVFDVGADGEPGYGSVAVLIGNENRYKIQANGKITREMIGLNFNLAYSGLESTNDLRSYGSPNTATKTSTACVDIRIAAQTGAAGVVDATNNTALQVVLDRLAPDSHWDDAYPNVVVRINQGRFVDPVESAIG